MHRISNKFEKKLPALYCHGKNNGNNNLYFVRININRKKKLLFPCECRKKRQQFTIQYVCNDIWSKIMVSVAHCCCRFYFFGSFPFSSFNNIDNSMEYRGQNRIENNYNNKYKGINVHTRFNE